MKKGFTLIELLAVLAVLAVVALITIPLVYNTVKKSKNEGYERSVDLYANAIRNAISTYHVEHLKFPKSFDDLEIEYEGNIECATEEIYNDGSFFIGDCKVNNKLVKYSYGTKQQVYKPQYYYFGFDWTGTVGETAAPVESERLTVPPEGKNYYLGYDVEDGKVSTAYVCFIRNEKEYCLKGNDLEAFEANNTVLEDAFKDVENACSFDDDNFSCDADDFSAIAYSLGDVAAGVVFAPCYVTSDGFACLGE